MKFMIDYILLLGVTTKPVLQDRQLLIATPSFLSVKPLFFQILAIFV